MKKILVFLSPVLLLILVSCSPQVDLTQSKQPQNVALLSFHVNLNNFDGDDFYGGNYGTLLLSLRDNAMENADLNGVHEVFNKSQNQYVKTELDSTYSIIRKTLKKYNWNLLPSNYLKGKVPYDMYDFPQGGKASNVIRKGDAALKISMYLSATDFETNFEGPHLFQVNYQPRLGIVIKMINSKGQTIWNGNTFVNANKDVVINENNVGGIQSLQIVQTPSLRSMVHEALRELLRSKSRKI